MMVQRSKKEQKSAFKMVRGEIILTLYTKSFKSLFTIALTILPFTSASQIDIIVLRMSKAAKITPYLTSLHFQSGRSCLINCITRL